MVLNMMCPPSIQKNVDNMRIGDSMFIEVFQLKLNDTPILPCMFCHQLGSRNKPLILQEQCI